VTLTNSGSSAATSLALTTVSPFSLVQNTCTDSLAAGASCSTGVVFSPSLKGTYSGTLAISSLTSSASVLLNGKGGVPGSVTFQPSSLTFAQTGVGLSSGVSTVTITNSDSVTSLSNFTITPAPAAEFKLATTTCGATLAAGASCTVGVTFTPSSAGVRSGTLAVSDSLLTAGSTMALAGKGFDFTVALSGSSSQTIANGQIAYFKLVITPLNGSTGTFTLDCGSLPSYSSCTFNPTSESIPANTTGNEEVEIATGQSTPSAHLARPFAWPILPLACGGLLLPLALWRRRKALLLVALLAILTGGVSSCAGSSIGQPSKPSGTGTTPAGSYTIPVTVTSNGISHQVTLTLIVD
jgi:hypothetical protein